MTDVVIIFSLLIFSGLIQLTELWEGSGLQFPEIHFGVLM